MKNYILIIIADILLAGDFAAKKVYQQKAGTSAKAGFAYNALIGLFTAIIFLAANGFKINLTPYSLIMSVMMSMLVTLYTIIGFTLLKSKGMTLYTLFLMTGGMIVPYIWGILFLNESVSFLRIIGLLFIIGGVFIANFSREKIKFKYLALCLGVFFFNGFVSIVSKMHSIETVYKSVSATDFVIIGGIIKFFISGLCYVFTKEIADKQIFEKKSLIPIIAISAMFSGVSYALQLIGAAELAATVLYPLVTGGSIILSSIAGRLLFKEQLTKNILASIIICFLGTLMFL